MASKRKLILHQDGNQKELEVTNKKHTLDSEEEDSDDYDQEHLSDSDIDGTEEGVANQQDDIQITPFNMREELEEGHFDKDGHYHWNKIADIKDNWLDNIDWVKVKTDKTYFDSKQDEDSSKLSESLNVFNEAETFKKILEFMTPNETLQMALQRIGKNRSKMSYAERLRRKKLGIVDESVDKITKITELTNEILTQTGNMDIYQESYEQIKYKLNNFPGTNKELPSTSAGHSFDMYSDDFVEKERTHMQATKCKEKNAP